LALLSNSPSQIEEAIQNVACVLCATSLRGTCECASLWNLTLLGNTHPPPLQNKEIKIMPDFLPWYDSTNLFWRFWWNHYMLINYHSLRPKVNFLIGKVDNYFYKILFSHFSFWSIIIIVLIIYNKSIIISWFFAWVMKLCIL
jgi:hypothetical protein